MKIEKDNLKQLKIELKQTKNNFNAIENSYIQLMREFESIQDIHRKAREVWKGEEEDYDHRIDTLMRSLDISENRRESLIKVIERLGEDIRKNQVEFERLRRQMESSPKTHNVAVVSSHYENRYKP